MDFLRKHGIAGLHNRLMRIGRSAKFSTVPDEIILEVEALDPEVRKLLMNTAEFNYVYEIPLFEAVKAAKEEIAMRFLHWGTVPTLQLYEALFACYPGESKDIYGQMLQRTPQDVVKDVFWLACEKNEPHVGALALSMLACPFENYLETMTSCSEMISIIHQYAPLVEGVQNERVAGLFLVALCDQEPVIPALLDTVNATLGEKSRIFIILGAANVIGEKIEQGRLLWKMAIRSFWGKQIPEYPTSTEVGMLEGVDEFRNVDEPEQMEETDALLQALMAIERSFGRGLLLLSALLARPYTEKLCVYAMQLMIRTNKLTNENINRLDDNLTKLGVYRNGKLSTVVDLLDCCLDAIHHITMGCTGETQRQDDVVQHQHQLPQQSQHQSQQIHRFDDQLMMDACFQARGLLYRVERQNPLFGLLLTEFIAKLLLSLEWINININDNRLKFVLQRITRSCRKINDGPYLFIRLGGLRNQEPGRLNIMQILKFFEAI